MAAMVGAIVPIPAMIIMRCKLTASVAGGLGVTARFVDSVPRTAIHFTGSATHTIMAHRGPTDMARRHCGTAAAVFATAGATAITTAITTTAAAAAAAAVANELNGTARCGEVTL